MLRGLMSLTVGLFATVITITFVEAAGMKIWPPPEGFDFASAGPAQVKAMVEAMPIAAKATIVAGWLLGAFAGGLMTTLVAKHGTKLALVPGVLVAVATFANAMQVPGPVWMPATGVLLALPLAWLGGRLGLHIVTPKPTDGGAWTGGSR